MYAELVKIGFESVCVWTASTHPAGNYAVKNTVPQSESRGSYIDACGAKKSRIHD